MDSMKINNIRKQSRFVIDIFIILLIALSLIFLMYFINSKFNEIITSDKEALLIEHDPNDPIHTILAEEITDFRPESCKMIEVYNEKFDNIFRVQFKEDQDHNTLNPLLEYPDLMDIFNNHENGHTEITIGNDVEDVYFRWTYTPEGERCLFIIYMSRPIVKNLWICTMICIFIMILVGILLIRQYQHNHEVQLLYYRKTSDAVRDAILR